MNAMLHYFLAVGVDDDELGDLSLERMPKPIGPAEEGPVPIYNCRSKYTALVLNLGSFARTGSAQHLQLSPRSSITTIRVRVLAFF